MGVLDGRVAIITGAARGLGRQHALLMAAEGALVVINDIATFANEPSMEGPPLQMVEEEIKRAGGVVRIHEGDVADYEAAGQLVMRCIEQFGRLDILVNNAGILRDASIAKMTERDWDDVMRVDLRGHFAPTRHAAAWWRDQAKGGSVVEASIINTSSGSGLFGNFGQANYAAAKAGVAAFTLTTAIELQAYGVRVNAIAPIARTRAAMAAPRVAGVIGSEEAVCGFDPWDAANVSPLVVYLARRDCPTTGGVFHVGGDELALLRGWTLGEILRPPGGGRWTNETLAYAAGKLVRGARAVASQQTTLSESMAGLVAASDNEQRSARRT